MNILQAGKLTGGLFIIEELRIAISAPMEGRV